MTVRVVRLVAGDEPLARATFALMAAVFDEGAGPLGDSYLASALSSSSFWALAALDGDEVVGGITAHELPMTRSEAIELFVYDLAVRQDRQRAGVGRLLVRTLVDAAAAAGIDVVFVPADDDDDHALAFYRSIGGRGAAVTMFDLGSG